ncbi:hypothetical protein P9W99_05110 [Bacillus cereus]|uniref:Uncharacterized protein n=3 Tax=Bacillus cereus group TaxID=86661 RepID=A0A9W5VBM4_BACCE|nr:MULTISPECIES: hypothetical protein [Bacillus cereus group]AIE37913.1 hypothetical protein BTK_35136 [Bacillus thuringiensis serovar kurstaki str. HD-1]AJK44515.1 hypothetical protein BG08_7068 [Bacillus thuringiensis serovar kurstaki]AMX80415.1 hypothetical protein BtBc_28765 [Bacillus thuringiensis]EOP13873.1 hypothetical protein IGG_06826 [Bacillus cereus HuB13-1]EOP50012.1 hypothetical protein IGU_06848 [Bacillus cereus ISP2954]
MVGSSDLSRIVSSSLGQFILVCCTDSSVHLGLLVPYDLAKKTSFFTVDNDMGFSLDDLGVHSDQMLFIFTLESVLISIPFDQVDRVITFTGSCIDHYNKFYVEPNEFLNEFKLYMSV